MASVFSMEEREESMSQIRQSVTELFRQYLRRQIAVQAEGLGLADPDGQVVPHEAVPMQSIDPRLAWNDALAVIHILNTSRTHERWDAPPDWPAFVAALGPTIALAFCIGNFPQMLRNVQPLLEPVGSVSDGCDAGIYASGSSVSRSQPIVLPPALLQWAVTAHSYPQLLVAAGVLRLARRFEQASELLLSNRETPAAWQGLRANEEAALAWHRGDAEEALASWQAQKDSVPVLFNRGMAALFLNRPDEARIALQHAVAQLPETNAWHHLGHLYLAWMAASS
jgi:tetratricopeptide (TPR) repeat protein